MNDLLIILYSVAIIVLSILLYVVTKIADYEISRKNKSTANYYERTYHPKPFLTASESIFLSKLLELENEINVRIVPQVNLGTIIRKESNSRWQSELNRNVDYGIFSKDYSKLLLLIELNDSSHMTPNRKERDRRVKDICKEAGIKLITFYTSMPNEKVYVKNRVKKCIYDGTLPYSNFNKERE